MSGKRTNSLSKRRAIDDTEHDETYPKKRSLVDYSKISDRHVDDARYEKQRQQAASATLTPSSNAAAPIGTTKMSSQMQAVVRLMTGKEERTIAEKIADSNRPTWEQYKKDNQDKFEFAGVDQRKMEEYRRELDKERDKILSRGVNHGCKKNKEDSSEQGDGSDSSASESGGRKKNNKKKHKHKKHDKKQHDKIQSRKRSNKHKKRKRHGSNSDHEDDDDDRLHLKKSSSRKKEKNSSTVRGAEGDDDAYRLSSFFAKGSSSDDSS